MHGWHRTYLCWSKETTFFVVEFSFLILMCKDCSIKTWTGTHVKWGLFPIIMTKEILIFHKSRTRRYMRKEKSTGQEDSYKTVYLKNALWRWETGMCATSLSWQCCVYTWLSCLNPTTEPAYLCARHGHGRAPAVFPFTHRHTRLSL